MQTHPTQKSALSLRKQVLGVIHHQIKNSLFLAFLAVGATGLLTQAAAVNLAEPLLAALPGIGTNSVSPPLATNSFVAEIQASLKSMQEKMDTAREEMGRALTSKPAQYATVVSNTAVKVREFALKDLGDGSEILKRADELVSRLRDRVESTRTTARGAGDAVDASLYAKVLSRLEPQLGQTIDAKATLVRMRAQLLKEAAALEAHGVAIACAEEAEALVSAAEAFKDVVREVGTFTVRLSDMIANLGQPPSSFLEIIRK